MIEYELSCSTQDQKCAGPQEEGEPGTGKLQSLSTSHLFFSYTSTSSLPYSAGKFFTALQSNW